MNTIDVCILVVLGIFGVKGFIRGIVIEIFTLIGMVVAYIIAIREMSFFSNLLITQLHLPDILASSIAFLVLFIGIVFVFRWIASALKLFARWTFIGWLDSLGGVLFGLFKGALIASLVLLLFSFMPFSGEIQKQQESSFLFKPIRSVAPFVFNTIKRIIPHSKDFYEELREGIREKTKEATDQVVSEKLDSLKTDIKDIGKSE